MTLDTEIKGKPQQVHGAADWLTGTLVPALEDTADDVRTADRRASGWGGEPGEAFSTRMDETSGTVDDIAGDARSAGEAIRTWADDLKRCQDDMEQVRDDARAGDLVVSGFTVHEPGPAPHLPPAGAVYGTQAEADAHDAQVERWNAHMEKVRVWNAAVAEAGRVRRRYAAACDDLTSTVGPMDYVMQTVDAETMAGEMGRHVGRYNDKMRLASDLQLLRSAERLALHELEHAPPGSVGDRVREWQRTQADIARTQHALDNPHARTPSADSPSRLGRAGKLLGPAGVVLGVVSDTSDGESLTQAVVSQGGGALAAAGTGALIGAGIGSIVPGPGTAVGAVVGGVIGGAASVLTGSFVDGAIDSLFENGADVGAAVSEGWDSVTDTVESVGDVAGGIVDGIGGLFD